MAPVNSSLRQYSRLLRSVRGERERSRTAGQGTRSRRSCRPATVATDAGLTPLPAAARSPPATPPSQPGKSKNVEISRSGLALPGEAIMHRIPIVDLFLAVDGFVAHMPDVDDDVAPCFIFGSFYVLSEPLHAVIAISRRSGFRPQGCRRGREK